MNASLNNRTFFATDKNLETIVGIAIVIGDWTFQSRRAGGSNHAFQARVTALRKPYERILNEKPGANDEALMIRQQEIINPILVEAAAEKLLLPKWDGVTMADIIDPLENGAWPDGVDPNAPAPFSKDNAILLFTRFPDVFNEYFAEASKMGNFRKQVVTDQAGNSASV